MAIHAPYDNNDEPPVVGQHDEPFAQHQAVIYAAKQSVTA
jgi:hypothetical protein